MKKYIISLVSALALSVSAQTNTPPVPPAPDTNSPAFTNILGPEVGKLLDFFSQTGSNWSFIPFVTILEDEDEDSIGGGFAATYSISDYAGAMLRLDYLKGDVFMPSGNFQLQVPLTIAGKFQVVPFILSGVATPLNAEEKSGEVVGIIGTGLGVRVSDRIGVVYDIEKWTHLDGLQHRFGLLFRF